MRMLLSPCTPTTVHIIPVRCGWIAAWAASAGPFKGFTYAYTYTYVFTSSCTYTYAHPYAYTSTYIHIYICTHTYMHISVYIYMYIPYIASSKCLCHSSCLCLYPWPSLSNGLDVLPFSLEPPVDWVRHLVDFHGIRLMAHLINLIPSGRLDFRIRVEPVGVKHDLSFPARRGTCPR